LSSRPESRICGHFEQEICHAWEDPGWRHSSARRAENRQSVSEMLVWTLPEQTCWTELSKKMLLWKGFIDWIWHQSLAEERNAEDVWQKCNVTTKIYLPGDHSSSWYNLCPGQETSYIIWIQSHNPHCCIMITWRTWCVPTSRARVTSPAASCSKRFSPLERRSTDLQKLYLSVSMIRWRREIIWARGSGLEILHDSRSCMRWCGLINILVIGTRTNVHAAPYMGMIPVC
jgi:hypothetical protein